MSSRSATSRSISGACTDPPATAGLAKRPVPSPTSGSAGDHTRRNATIEAVASSEATMSVSSTEK